MTGSSSGTGDGIALKRHEIADLVNSLTGVELRVTDLCAAMQEMDMLQLQVAATGYSDMGYSEATRRKLKTALEDTARIVHTQCVQAETILERLERMAD